MLFGKEKMLDPQFLGEVQASAKSKGCASATMQSGLLSARLYRSTSRGAYTST